MEVIPRTLAQNCGTDVVRVLTELRAKHATEGGKYFGINGNTGKIDDMKAANIWDPLAVKVQTYKTAIESACMLLRIDDIVSGIKKEKKAGGGPQPQGPGAEEETVKLQTPSV
jgi:T-complex protein 1 subunit gamma